MNLNKKYRILVVALVLTLVLGFTLYKILPNNNLYTSQTTSEPTPTDFDFTYNWKTYSINNLTFKYPRNYDITVNNPNHTTIGALDVFSTLQTNLDSLDYCKAHGVGGPYCLEKEPENFEIQGYMITNFYVNSTMSLDDNRIIQIPSLDLEMQMSSGGGFDRIFEAIIDSFEFSE